MHRFKNRIEAAEQLVPHLRIYQDDHNAVVVAIPRGGVVTGKVIADHLNLPLELALVKKIGHPSNEEYAIGAVSLNHKILEGGLHIPESYIREQVQKKRKILSERAALFYERRTPLKLTGKTVILTDDGVATGNTLMAAMELIRKEKPECIVVAVPVGPKDVIHELSSYADEIICLENPEPFVAIGAWYENFSQVSDEEAVLLFQEHYQDRLG